MSEPTPEEIVTAHVLIGCPYCTGARSFGEVHWHCPAKALALWTESPWYFDTVSADGTRRTCHCGGDCYGRGVRHG